MSDKSRENDRLIKQMTDYYAHRAPWHDDYMSFESSERLERLMRPIVDRFEPLIKDHDIIEVACGTGNWTGILARRAAHVTAVDACVEVIDLAQTKLAGVDNVTFVQHDAYRLGDLDERFDGAFAGDWFSHVPCGMRATFLNGLHRLLLPGSWVVLVDMTPREADDVLAERTDADGNNVATRELPDGSRFEVVKNYPIQAEMEALVADVADRSEFVLLPVIKRWMFVYRLK